MDENAKKLVDEINSLLADNGWILDEKTTLDLAIYIIEREKAVLKGLSDV